MECSTYHLGEIPLEVDSAVMAEYTDLTLALIAEDLASWEYPDNAMKPMVARMARMAMTTMSSAMLKPERILFFKAFPMAVFKWIPFS